MMSKCMSLEPSAALPNSEQHLQGADCLCLTGTGFVGEQRQQVRHLADAAGCEYRGDLVFGRTTHLIFRTHAGALHGSKVQTAQQWGIPVVHWQWLLDSVSRGVLMDVRPYQLGCGTAAHLQPAERQPLASLSSPAMQSAEAAVSCSTTTAPAAKSPGAILVSQQLQSGQCMPQALHPSSTFQSPAAVHAPWAAEQTGLQLGPAQQMAYMHEPVPVLTPAQHDTDPDRQFGCAEHWRRALGNITNRRRPRGKQRDAGKELAMPQPQLYSPLATGAVDGATSYSNFDGSCSKGVPLTMQAVQLPCMQQVRLPPPERRRAAINSQLPLMMLHTEGGMTPEAQPRPLEDGNEMHMMPSPLLPESPTVTVSSSSPAGPLAYLPAVSPCSSSSVAAAEQQGHGLLRQPSLGNAQSPLTTPPRAGIRLWGLQPMPLGSSALRHHQLPAGTHISYYRYLEVRPDNADVQQHTLVFDLQDNTQAALLYYDDVSDRSGNPAHALVYAGLLAAYELHGEAWLEHCYFYDREDIRTDRRGNGRAYLRKHSVRDDELIASPYVYHSRASAVEGQFRLFHSRSAWESSEVGRISAKPCDTARRGSSQASAEVVASGVLTFFCERGWDRCTGRPWLMR